MLGLYRYYFCITVTLWTTHPYCDDGLGLLVEDGVEWRGNLHRDVHVVEVGEVVQTLHGEQEGVAVGGTHARSCTLIAAAQAETLQNYTKYFEQNILMAIFHS